MGQMHRIGAGPCRLAGALLIALLLTGAALRQAQARELPFLLAVSFANGQDGWVSGHTVHQAFIYHTTNGGKSWAQQTVGFDAEQLQLVDADNGWAAGFAPPRCGVPHPCRWEILATHDAGRTWLRQLDGGRCRRISSLQFITALEGWAIEGNDPCVPPLKRVTTRIVGTRDGGHSWHAAFAPSLRLTSVHFGSPLEGWAAADAFGGKASTCRTVLLHSPDGGASWRRQLQVPGYCAGWVDFVDSRHGWLLVTNMGACSMGGCYDNRLYRSVDGGRHWTLEQKAGRAGQALWSGGSGFLQRPVFVTPRVGYIPVDAGAGPGFGGVDVTHDGGQHWVRKQPYGLQAGDISPVNASEAWAIGCMQKNGTGCSVLLHTLNAGRSWSLHRPGQA